MPSSYKLRRREKADLPQRAKAPVEIGLLGMLHSIELDPHELTEGYTVVGRKNICVVNRRYRV